MRKNKKFRIKVGFSSLSNEKKLRILFDCFDILFSKGISSKNSALLEKEDFVKFFHEKESCNLH